MASDWLQNRPGQQQGPRQLPGARQEGDSQRPQICWIEAAENPWGVPVLDVRPVTLAWRSYTQDQKCSENALSFGHEDGRVFDGQISKTAPRIPASLKIPVDIETFFPGALFLPRCMEHKWALYFHSGRILCIRSWQRKVVAVAHTKLIGQFIHVDIIDGTFTVEDEDRRFTRRVFDFLLRSHAFGLEYPAPLPAGMEADPSKAAVWCMAMFGNQAHFATPHALDYPPLEKPLRTYTSLHLAVARGDSTYLNRMLDFKVPIDLRDRDGAPLLHWAVARPDTEMLTLLLERGLPVDVRSADGATALMRAAQCRNMGNVAFLLDKGADPNACDGRGFTALHRAAEMGEKNIVRLLLAQGATANVDAEGQTPRSLAASHGQTEIVKLLDGN
jgi:hypothetical protein